MLSKSRFVDGLQCSKLLWLRVHERDALELVPDAGLQAIFDQGNRVGELARERFPGGILIPYDDRRVEATREAIVAGKTVLYEALVRRRRNLRRRRHPPARGRRLAPDRSEVVDVGEERAHRRRRRSMRTSSSEPAFVCTPSRSCT